MANCQKCGMELHYLDGAKRECVVKMYKLNSDGSVEARDSIVLEVSSEVLCCPYCGELLFEDTGDAVSFLRGNAP